MQIIGLVIKSETSKQKDYINKLPTKGSFCYNQNMDLDKIKRIACNLADEDVMETDYSPVIISHPYFNSGIMPNENGEFINILEDEVEYDKAINRIKKAIMERKDAFSILAMVNKPYMLVFVYLIFDYLSDEDKGLLLRYAWISSEFPNADVNVSRDELRSMFKACKPEYLMEGVDLAFYKDMPWRFTVYRGTKKENDYDALSWTLDYEKAEWFANRFGTKGKVISKKVKRKDVLAFFNDEDESEIII